MAKSAPSPIADPKQWNRATLPRVVLVCGPDAALREEALNAIRRAAFGKDEGTWIVFHGRASANEADELTPATIIDEICTRPMFAADDELKVVVVRSADFLLGTHHRLFLDQLGAIPDQAVLVFETGAPAKLKTTSLYKEIATRGGLVALEALVGDFDDTSRLEAQIVSHAAALGLNLSHGALLALLHQSAKNLGVIEQELAKLALSLRNNAAGAPDGAPLPVNENDVAEICATTSVATPFAFANALMSGEVKQALETAGTLFDRGIADVKKPGKLITRDDSILTLVLAAVAYKLTQLQDIRESLDQGKSEMEVFKQARLFYERASEARKALRRFDASGLRRAMDALFAAFMDIRRGGGEPRAILERLVFRINMR